MKQEVIKAFLEAYATGDAYGKATEYCSKTEIKEKLGKVLKILPPEQSLTHKDLFYGQITDDTEQNIYLLNEYILKKSITAEDTAHTLLKWFEETDALKYIGPSSLKALNAIKRGSDIEKAGIAGITCGGIMRTPSVVLLSRNEKELVKNIVECLKPTHNTAVAMEAGMSYAFALLEAENKNASISSIIDKAKKGAEIGYGYGYRTRTAGVAPSIQARLCFLEKVIVHIADEEDLKTLLYDILGATLASYDVASSVFGIFMFTKGNTVDAIRISTELGGDTDTIGSLVAGLCTMYSKQHNIERSEIELIERTNKLNFDGLATKIYKFRNTWQEVEK